MTTPANSRIESALYERKLRFEELSVSAEENRSWVAACNAATKASDADMQLAYMAQVRAVDSTDYLEVLDARIAALSELGEHRQAAALMPLSVEGHQRREAQAHELAKARAEDVADPMAEIIAAVESGAIPDASLAKLRKAITAQLRHAPA